MDEDFRFKNDEIDEDIKLKLEESADRILKKLNGE